MTFPAGSRILAEDLLLIDTPVTGAWATWSPTWSNFTVGNATTSYRYKQMGKTVHFWVKVVLGSTSAMGTSPSFTLPATPASGLVQAGTAEFTDTGTSNRIGYPRLSSGSTVVLLWFNSTVAAGITSTSPFTWAAGDTIDVHGTYEAA